jgi:hypothetical protein
MALHRNNGISGVRNITRAVLLTALLITGNSGQQARSAQTSEYQIKAAFLLNFAKFIEWSATPALENERSFAICILGEDPFGKALEDTVAGERIESRRVTIRKISAPNAGSCQILYVSATHPQIPSLPAAVGTGVLIVGEGETFAREGGMIAFIIENRRVRFDINQRAAQRAGLKVSSRLLAVARSVAQ